MSVRKRRWTTQSGEEREAWIVDYFDQERTRHIETFDRKKDADARHADVKVDVKAGVHVAASTSITVSAAGEDWIRAGEAHNLERTTLEQYRQHLKFHINPLIGMRKLSDLSAQSVRKFEDQLRTEILQGKHVPPRLRGKKRSPALVRKVLVSLGSILADAQERGLAAHNAVRDLRRNRRRGKEHNAEKRQRGKLKVGVDIPTPNEIRAIVEHAKPRWRAFLITAAFTGLRASELRGLRWEDVDLKANELHVHQRADRYRVIGKPKSHAGARTVPFGKTLANTLREWKLASPHRELVFPNGNGDVEFHQHIVSRGLIPAQLAAGLVAKGKAKYTGLHSLRHFYASWCINRPEDGGLGLPPKVVQERLGHGSITMTYDRYGHLFPRGDDAGAMDKAEAAILG
jgi:integrase